MFTWNGDEASVVWFNGLYENHLYELSAIIFLTQGNLFFILQKESSEAHSNLGGMIKIRRGLSRIEKNYSYINYKSNCGFFQKINDLHGKNHQKALFISWHRGTLWFYIFSYVKPKTQIRQMLCKPFVKVVKLGRKLLTWQEFHLWLVKNRIFLRIREKRKRKSKIRQR